MPNAISAVRQGIERAAATGLVALVLAMVTLTFSQVVLRYGFNAPLRWSEELARYIFVWISFLGLYLAYRKGAHLGLDLTPHLLPEAARKILGVAVEAIILVTLVTAVASSGRLVSISLNQGSAVLGLPMIYVYSAFLVGASLVSIDVVLGWLQRALSAGRGGVA